MKKIFLAAVAIVFIGTGCTKPVAPVQENTQPVVVPEKTTSAETPATTKHALDYYVQNFSKAPSVSVTELDKKGELVEAFTTNLETIKCNPDDENDEYSMCCSVKEKTFTRSVVFYTWKTTDWTKGGDVEFYIDDQSGKCVDGGFAIARGPFKDNLLILSQSKTAALAANKKEFSEFIFTTPNGWTSNKHISTDDTPSILISNNADPGIIINIESPIPAFGLHLKKVSEKIYTTNDPTTNLFYDVYRECAKYNENNGCVGTKTITNGGQIFVWWHRGSTKQMEFVLTKDRQGSQGGVIRVNLQDADRKSLSPIQEKQVTDALQTIITSFKFTN